MNKPIFKYGSKPEILESTEEVAQYLFYHLLWINDTRYYLTDFEFYIKTKNETVFKDNYTYGHDLQLTSGKLYAHASGIDITWGSESIYVGVLIRGIAKLHHEAWSILDYISGPQNVATELIAQISLNGSTKMFFEKKNSLRQNESIDFYHTTKTKRVGLANKNNPDDDHYLNLPLRYIGFFHAHIMKTISNGKSIVINNKEQIIINDYTNGALDKEKVKALLNYMPSIVL